jgi:hypothetical protein
MAGPVKKRAEMVEGRRVEEVEWGHRQLWGDVALGHQAAHTESCGGNEKWARAIVYNPERHGWIMPPLVLVRRTVVTYTTAWEIVPGDPPVRTNMRPQGDWTWERALAVVPPMPGEDGRREADDPQGSLF